MHWWPQHACAPCPVGEVGSHQVAHANGGCDGDSQRDSDEREARQSELHDVGIQNHFAQLAG